MQTARKEILRHMMKQIPPYIYLKTLPIPEWTVKSGRHVSPGQFEYDDAPPKVMRLGDSWTTTYDHTLWLSADLTIPEDYINHKLYLELDFGGEAIVRIDGKIAGGISSRMNSGWVHRDQVFLPKDIRAGQTLHIEVEATVDSAALCDVVLAGGHEMTYSLAKARLAAVDPVVESYYFDVMMVYSALDYIKDDAVKARVFAALDDSLHLIQFDFDESEVRASFAPAAELLWERLGKIRWAPQGEVIMAGHSHIDVAWLWTIREVVRKCVRTFSSTVALLDRYPEAVFTQSQAVLYDYMKKYYPEVYSEVKRKIADNQWEVVGNAWVEADTNVAGGEALIRQLLYGKKFFETEFGISSDIYWLPDCFGFSWALPQIIKKSGMKYFLTSKLKNNDTNRFPHTLFTWRGIDGSDVLAYMQRTAYNGEYDPAKLHLAWEANDQKTVSDVTLSMYGYGDGGGGPTLGMLENGRRLSKIPGIPASKPGSAKEFFDRVSQFQEEFPLWNDEMYYENHRGTYTSQAFAKKNNRKGEFLLTRSEMACAFAAAFADADYPAEELEEIWKILLTNQFHDLLPGTSIHEAHEDSKKDYAEMHKRGNTVLQSALQKLTERILLPEDSVVCWNFTSWPQTGLVTVTLPKAGLAPADENGRPLPYAVKETGSGAEVTFLAKDVPAMGYKAFRLVPAESVETGLYVSETRLENEYLRIELDENGYLTSVYDKANGREVLSGKGNVLQIFQDKPIHESAWNLELNYQKKGWEPAAESVTVSECSPVRAAVRVVRRFNKSVITQDIVLAAGAKRVDFETHVDWKETEKILKASFPVAVKNSFAAYEIQHGAICRPTHWNTSYDKAKFEVCGHKWADLSEGDYGVSLLNDCKYGYDIHDSRMRISLLRAPICPDTTGDKGEHTFTYSLYPHANVWQQSGVVAEAFALNVPMRAVYAERRDGALPAEFSFVSLDKSHVVIDAIKRAEDGDGWILRVYEAEEKRGKVRVKWNLPIKSVSACNMMEQDEREIPVSDGGFAFDITPHSVETFRIRG